MNSRLRASLDRFAGNHLAKGVVALVLLVTIGLAVSGPARSPGPSASPGGSPVAVASPAASPTTQPQPTATPEPWDDLVVEPFVPTAEITPDDVDSIGAAPGTTFTLRSLTATTAVELGSGLRIDPPTAYSLEAGATPDLATIRPSTPLVAGVRYRFRLESPSGALAGTWAFVARAPLHVVGTLPGDLAVDVPRNTGIEVTFDQDGTTGVSERFSIEPAVPGRIQQYDRAWAFIPESPLAAATIYTVTISSGVGITGSTEVLESDVTFRFETAIAAAAGGPAHVTFGKSILEIRPDEQPVVGINELDGDEVGAELPSSIGVTVHRFPSFDAVEAAGLALAGPDSWAIVSPTAVVSTSGLDLVAEVDAAIIDSSGGPALRIPTGLARGHYLVSLVQQGAPEQLLLQVSNLSAFAQTATGTTVVWVNDMARNSGVAGATIEVVGGATLGTTDGGGLLRRATPAELRVDLDQPSDEESFRPARLLSVAAADGRRLLVPLGIWTSWPYAEPTWWGYGDPTSDWWLLFHTDRSTYRQTDTIHVYGTVRARDDRSVPDGIELRLRPEDGSPDAPIIRVPVNASKRGVFVADVHLDDLPRGSYQLDLYVGDQRLSTMWISVSEIRKPAYQVTVTTDRHAYLYGQTARVSVVTSFYDGTVVPGVNLRFSGFDGQATATTDPLGAAHVDLQVEPSDHDPEGIRSADIGVRPVSPEEGEIDGTRYVLVAPSRAWLSGDGSVVDGRIVVEGKLTWTDMAGLDAAWAAGTVLEDPAGRPIAGGTVRARVIHLVPIRTQIGTSYDFIEKRVVPVYEYDVKEVELTTRSLTAAADGTFRLSFAAPVATDGYKVVLTAEDPEGRRVRKTIHAAQAATEVYGARRPYLVQAFSCGGYSPTLVTGLDEAVTVTMHDGDGSTAEGRFLFLVSQIGSVEATVQDAATFSRTLRAADLPGFTVRAVWVSDAGYAVSDAVAAVDPDDKAITIRLEPDRARYRPGAKVTLAVTTTDRSGDPIAADVVIQGVDEKLYTLGFAETFDPLGELLAMPASGFLETFRSHAVPREDDGGCGAEGGDRDDFRDTVTFQRISTDANGRGSVTFDLSDDLTSWRLSAVAVSGALDAGHASVLIPVGLPFFVDATLAPEYLVGDQAILRIRAYGGRLAVGDRATFTISAPSLGLAATTVEAAAFESVRVPLPAMVAGDHAIRVEGRSSIDGTTFTDSLVRTVHVIDSRLGTVASSYEALGPGFAPTGGDGLTRYVVTDEGRGRFISLLEELAASTSARFDSSAAAELARQLLIDEFGVPASSLPATGFDAWRYELDGIALLPYASGDLSLSARAALVARSKLNAERLGSWFDELVGQSITRERRIVALAGRAGLGDDVLADLRAIDVTALTIRERLWVALGLAAAGDEAGARAIERALLEEHGQQLGPWVRLAAGTTLQESIEASGLLLLLTARLGDPLAHDVARYLLDHRSDVQVFPLELIGYARAMVERVPREAGRFAWTIGGERTEVDLEPGGSFMLVLTRGQRATLALEPLQGTLAVATTWTTTTAALPSSGGMTVTRTVTPAANAPADRLVRVTMRVTFGPQATMGCYRLTDLLPSGLAPVVTAGTWYDEEEDSSGIGPYEVVGQRVSWCASPKYPGRTYAYSARVVSPGTYRWEPAVVQSQLAPTIGASTPSTTYVIR